MTPVRGLLPEEIGGMWTTLRPLIERWLPYSGGAHTLRDIRSDLLSGKKQLVLCEQPFCALITEILKYPNGESVCNVFLTAGTLPLDWKDILAGLEQWAREKNCTAIEMRTDRKGWTRLLPNWRQVMVTYRKDLGL